MSSAIQYEQKDLTAYMSDLGQRARAASQLIALADTQTKNQALRLIADELDQCEPQLLAANAIDMRNARERNISSALLDRLELTPARLKAMSDGVRQIAMLPDPVGVQSETRRQPNGLEIGRMRVPLGVIGIIYESRPNVTADAAVLCLKSGNAVILRGGSEAIQSNQAIAACLGAGLEAAGLSADIVQVIDTPDREAVGILLTMTDSVDVLIPRGGKSLVERVASEARVPVIKHLDGICHVFIDEHADHQKAVDIAVNSKTYRYGICGAMETLLVAAPVAEQILPAIKTQLDAAGVEIRGCERTAQILDSVTAATPEDWATEYLAPILSVRVVDTPEQAMAHIAEYGSAHTDAIVTENLQRARQFVRTVDSSSVMVNAATCFADGYQYGLGAEIGISTDRLHVRGPVGLEGLTTEKYVVTGEGTTRTG